MDETEVTQTVTLNMDPDVATRFSLKNKRMRNTLMTIIAILLVYVLVKSGEAGEKLILMLIHKIV